MIEDAQNRCCLFRVGTTEDLQSNLPITSRYDDRSPAKDPRLNNRVATARGGGDTGAVSRDRPLHQVKPSVNMPLSGNTSTEVTSAIASKEVSGPRNQRLQSVTTEGNSSVQKTVEQSNPERAEKRRHSTVKEVQEPSSDDGHVDPPAVGSTRNDNRTKHRKEDTRHTQHHYHHQHHHRGREPSSHRSHHDENNPEMRLSRSGRSHDDRHRGEAHSSKRPHCASSLNRRDRGKDDITERHRHHSSNREHERKHDRGQDYRCMGRSDEPGQSKRPKLHDSRVASHSSTATSLCSSDIPASTAYNRGDKVTPVQSNQSSTTTSTLYGNPVSNEDEMVKDNIAFDTRDYLVASAIERNPSMSSYLRQLQEQEKNQEKNATGRSPSEIFANISPSSSPNSPTNAVVTNASTGSSRSPAETAVISDLCHGNSTVTSHSTSKHPLASSWPSTSHLKLRVSPSHEDPGTSASFSRLSNQFSSFRPSPSSSAAISSNQRPPLVDNHGRSSTINGELEPGAQQAANNVRNRQQHPRGPIEIETTGDLVHGWRRPHGGSRERTAHVTSGDVTSLRERATGERGQRRGGIRHTRPRIDKKKLSESFRGRKNWK